MQSGRILFTATYPTPSYVCWLRSQIPPDPEAVIHALEQLSVTWRATVTTGCRPAAARGRQNAVGITFASFSAQQLIVRDSELDVHTFLPGTQTLHYPDTLTLLHSLKALGVNTLLENNKGLLTRQKLTKLIQAYERLRQPEGLPLTYQVIYGVLQKSSDLSV